MAATMSPERSADKGLTFSKSPYIFKIQGYGMGPGPRRAVKQDPQDVQRLHVVTHAQLIDRSSWWHQTQGEQVTTTDEQP